MARTLLCPISLESRLHNITELLRSVCLTECVTLRKVLLPVFSVLVLALACNGAVWADALHGQCNGTGTGTCSDNGFNTPLGNSTTFGFTISSGPQTGDLLIDILVPNNYAV